MDNQNFTADLVARAAAGDEDAWRQIVERFSGLVWSVTRAFRLARADALDVSQAVWLKLARHIHGVDDPERLGLWLSTTTRRECLQLLSRNRERPSPLAELTARPSPRDLEPEETVIQREQRRLLWTALNGLAEPCRALLRMLAVDPRPTYAEIAAALSMSQNTISRRRDVCLSRLRQAVSELAGGG